MGKEISLVVDVLTKSALYRIVGDHAWHFVSLSEHRELSFNNAEFKAKFQLPAIGYKVKLNYNNENFNSVESNTGPLFEAIMREVEGGKTVSFSGYQPLIYPHAWGTPST